MRILPHGNRPRLSVWALPGFPGRVIYLLEELSVLSAYTSDILTEIKIGVNLNFTRPFPLKKSSRKNSYGCPDFLLFLKDKLMVQIILQYIRWNKFPCRHEPDTGPLPLDFLRQLQALEKMPEIQM